MEKYKLFLLKQISIGYGVFVVIGLSITFIVYPLIMHLCKDWILESFLMFLASFFIRLTMILFYDWKKIDYLLIESFKARIENGDNGVIRRIKKLLKIGKIPLFAGLFFTDPVIMVLYFREGYFKWNNISSTKLKILFVLSNLTCAVFIRNFFTLISYIINQSVFY